MVLCYRPCVSLVSSLELSLTVVHGDEDEDQGLLLRRLLQQVVGNERSPSAQFLPEWQPSSGSLSAVSSLALSEWWTAFSSCCGGLQFCDF